MNKRDAYIDLDKRLWDLMRQFWIDYLGIEVNASGSVLHGEWHVMRSNEFDGIKFKLSDKQMSELIGDGKTIVKEDDIINQKEYEGEDE